MSEIKLTVNETKLQVIRGKHFNIYADRNAQLGASDGQSKEAVVGVVRSDDGRSDKHDGN